MAKRQDWEGVTEFMGVKIVTHAWLPSVVSEELTISASHQAARIGDQPERMAPLAGAFPGRADQRPVARED